MLGAGEHVVARGGDGGTPREPTISSRCPSKSGWIRSHARAQGIGVKAIPGLHAANLSCLGPRRQARYMSFERGRRLSRKPGYESSSNLPAFLLS